MILIVHILLGALIVLKVKPLFLALILALISHYFLDLLPHRDYSIDNIRKKDWQQAFRKEFILIFFDIFSAVVLIFLLSENVLLSFIGAFFSTLPDGLHLLYRIRPNEFLRIHQQFHQKINWSENKTPLFWGVLTQVIIVAITIYLL